MKWQTAEMNALVQTGRSNRKQPTRKRTSSGAVSVPEVFSLKVHGDSVSEPDCPLQRPRHYSPACVCVCCSWWREGGWRGAAAVSCLGSKRLQSHRGTQVVPARQN